MNSARDNVPRLPTSSSVGVGEADRISALTPLPHPIARKQESNIHLISKPIILSFIRSIK